MKIYSIKNEKLGFFNRPIYCESDAEALSYIQNVLMSDADRALSGLKDVLSLYKLGDIDFTTGYINSYAFTTHDGEEFKPVLVCSLKEIFDSIPEDKIKPALTREDVEKCYSMFKELSGIVTERFDDVYEKLHDLDKCKKGGALFS